MKQSKLPHTKSRKTNILFYHLQKSGILRPTLSSSLGDEESKEIEAKLDRVQLNFVSKKARKANHLPWLKCFYMKKISKELKVDKDVDELEHVAFLSLCLSRNSELVGMELGSLYTKKYLPHRVGMQLGLDQDILGQVDYFRYKDEIIVDPYKAAWKNYSMPITDIMLLDVVVALSSISVPCFTLKYVEWWNQSKLGMGEKPSKDDFEVRSQSDSVHENGYSSMAYNGVEMIDLAKRSNEIVNVVGGGGLKRERVDMVTKLETLIGKLQGDIVN
ncbi:Aminotransferase-like mobile domain containing protein [Senna tora]|uniref:Aminotransferase-like mobile domain containing protein n=1 Tax=Senna tora TaxID=362788 RepID=A0A834SVC5_9FABA|nr:Aminotransferase-like mobile domain containing protein [Senna tora]